MNNKCFTMFMNYSLAKDLFLPVTVSFETFKTFFTEEYINGIIRKSHFKIAPDSQAVYH